MQLHFEKENHENSHPMKNERWMGCYKNEFSISGAFFTQLYPSPYGFLKAFFSCKLKHPGWKHFPFPSNGPKKRRRFQKRRLPTWMFCWKLGSMVSKLVYNLFRDLHSTYIRVISPQCTPFINRWNNPLIRSLLIPALPVRDIQPHPIRRGAAISEFSVLGHSAPLRPPPPPIMPPPCNGRGGVVAL